MYFIFLVYALAFCIPAWAGNDTMIGLWARCTRTSDSGGFEDCSAWAFGDGGQAWMDGVRAVWLAGMFFYVLAVLFSFVENCCSGSNKKDYGVTGVLAILAGLSGAVGVIVLAIEVELHYSDTMNYYWGYMLACITSGLTLILAIILLITRNVKSYEKSPDDRTADYVLAHKSNPYTAEFTNHGYSHDNIPLANGVTYQHTPAAHPYTTYQEGYNGNKIPQGRNQAPAYGQPGYNPYGYYGGAPNQRHSVAESADLSNGYTSELINAEHSLNRSKPIAQRGDFIRGGDYGRQDFPARNDYYPNGTRAY